MSVPLRICLLSERLKPPYDEGFKNVAVNLIRALGQRHHLLALTCFGADDPTLGLRDVPANRLLLSSALARAIGDFQPDMLYYLPTASTTLFGLMRARVLSLYARRKPVALVALQPRRLGRWSPLARFLSPDLILATTPAVKAALPSLRCPVVAVPLGVDAGLFRPAEPGHKARLRAKYGLPAQGWVLLHVGHIKGERNMQALARLQAEAANHADDAGLQVLVVGSTSTHQEAAARQQLVDSGVRVIDGYLPIVEAYQMADAYIFPVVEEIAAIGVPLSILEAMACNLPVLTTPFGGLPGLFQERPEQGFRYLRDQAEWMAAIRATRQLAAADTRALVAPYTWPRVAEQLVEAVLRHVRSAGR